MYKLFYFNSSIVVTSLVKSTDGRTCITGKSYVALNLRYKFLMGNTSSYLSQTRFILGYFNEFHYFITIFLIKILDDIGPVSITELR